MAGFLLVITTACTTHTAPPAPYGAVPSTDQINWQQLEYYMFIHLGPNTFNDVEWGDGKEDPKSFNPTGLDCRQWAATAKAAGMKGVIITAKHHDGFCLWPSKYSTHTVRESAWKGGKGDVLKELSEACREYGMKFGVYLSPWDQNHPQYGTPEYNQVFANTLNEVLSNYGEVFEQWFDGANGEGPNGKKQTYDWNLFHQTVYRNQPHAIIFSDVGPGCRWMGNEKGIAGTTNWSTMNIEGFTPGWGAPPTKILNEGEQGGKAWIPAEVDVSIRPGWFYSPSTDAKVKSVHQLMDIYYTSVGRNANLLLNVPPDRSGRIHPTDSTRLMEFRKAREEAFSHNLMTGATLTAGNTRGNAPQYAAENVLNDDYHAYWATNDNALNPYIEIDLKQSQTFNRLLLQEYIPLGQRVASFNVKYWNEETGQWDELTDATTIGYKRILRFSAVTAQKLKIEFNALACPAISSIQLYNAPEQSTQQGTSPLRPGAARKRWKIVSPASAGIKNITDGNHHTSATIAINDEVIIDLEKNLVLRGFTYVPSTATQAPNIYRYDLYGSEDGKQWKQLISNGRFDNIANNPIAQQRRFDKEETLRYLKIKPIETVGNATQYTIAEIGIVTK